MWLRTKQAAAVGLAVALAACNSDGSSAEEYAREHGCDQNWVDFCNEMSCDPNADANWADCKLNGWADKRVITHCPVNTEWPGDDAALCKPGPDEGIQLHYGPSSYSDADEIARYTLAPQTELEDCYLVESDNDQLRYVNQYSGRMRPQSHHMILWGVKESAEDPLPRGLGSCRGSATLGSSFYVGSQNLRIDIPSLSSTPDPVDEIAARPLPAQQLFSIDMHYLNRTLDPILRESWINIFFADESKIEKEAKAIFLVQPLINVSPRTTGTIVRGSCAAPKARTVRLLNGHFHEHGQRFSVYRTRPGQDRELVYNSFDWSDPYIAYYSNSVQNPEPNRALGISGGFSGQLHLAAGEGLEWECEFDNPSDVTVRFGETGADQMCILFGMYIDDEPDASFNWNAASVGPGVPCVDSERASGISLN